MNKQRQYFAGLVDADGHPAGPKVPVEARVRQGARSDNVMLTGSIALYADSDAERWGVFDADDTLLALGDAAPASAGSTLLFILRPGQRRREIKQDVKAAVSYLPWSAVSVGALFAVVYLIGWWSPGWLEALVTYAYTVITATTIGSIARPWWFRFPVGYLWPIYWAAQAVRWATADKE